MPATGNRNVARPEMTGSLHDFRFDRESRRMVCEKCRGLMNQVPVYCLGKPPRIGALFDSQPSGVAPESNRLL
jgi:hypothetical protein